MNLPFNVPPGFCGTGVVEVTRPLSKLALLSQQRGVADIRLDPPPDPIVKGRPVPMFDTNTGNSCIVGELLCVTLGLTLDGLDDASEAPLENAFVWPSVRAKLRWGLGGATFRADCDWRHGTQIAICADTVRVEAQYLKNSLPWAPVQETKAPTFLASAGVGYGDHGRNSNPATLTELVQIQHSSGSPPGSNVQRIPIPPFATSFNIFLVSGTATAKVYGFGQAYAVGYAIASPPNPYSVENAFPLFNDARFLELTNTTANDGTLIAYVIFGLAL